MLGEIRGGGEHGGGVIVVTAAVMRPGYKGRRARGGKMRQKAAIVAGRRRQSVTFGRLAAWLGFASAVGSQAALLAAGYFATDDASPHAMRNAGLAGGLALIGLAVLIVARRAGKRAQSSAVNLGRVPLRLVAEAGDEVEITRRRPAA